MGSKGKNSVGRKSLFNADPHCHWCRREVFLWMDRANSRNVNCATLDHIKGKLECENYAQYNNSENKVLACWECNQRRNQEYHAANPMPARPRYLAEKFRPATNHTQRTLKKEAKKIPISEINRVIRIQRRLPKLNLDADLSRSKLDAIYGD